MRLSRELKRRKVLHTVSLYIVGCWVALQVVEVLSDAGLPPMTMRYLLVAMSAGFPFVVVIAWFFDVSREGVTRTPPATGGEDLPAPNLGDHALLLGILAVVALNAYLLSTPTPDAGSAQAPEQRTLVVVPFDDIGLVGEDEPLGEAIAGELRDELSRVVGLKVLGPETSRVIQAAGDSREAVAAELGVTSILAGDVRLHAGKLQMNTRLISLPEGNTVWQAVHESGVVDGAGLQRRVVQAVIDAILPPASAGVAHTPRISENECAGGYEFYLRGKQLMATTNRRRGLELLQEATRKAPDCAVAWEGLATASLGSWTKAELVSAGLAARRALELDEASPRAWAVLAEIAEDEERWSESDELFLRALYVDPADAFSNMQYGEALLARGRVREAMHYALEAYRYEPASTGVNWKITLVARYLGDAETLIRHARIYRELRGDHRFNGWDELAEGYRLLGDVERSLAYFEEGGDIVPDWFPQCVKASLDPAQSDGLAETLGEAVRDYLGGELGTIGALFRGGYIIECATWIGEPDLVVDIYEQQPDLPTEALMMFFRSDAAVLRQTEYFRRRVVDSGLLDHWRERGWSDYCRPDGDSFVCN
jgi:TolB-like protein